MDGKRAEDWGIRIGRLERGPLNKITDAGTGGTTRE